MGGFGLLLRRVSVGWLARASLATSSPPVGTGAGRQQLQNRTPAGGYRKGGANIKPPADHNALTPRDSLMALPVPTFRSKTSP
jgi:hypothetical protein